MVTAGEEGFIAIEIYTHVHNELGFHMRHSGIL